MPPSPLKHISGGRKRVTKIGDRSNIVIKQYDNSEVWLYGHWMGDRAIACALHGLKSGRSTDEQYLARIIFCKMVESDVEGELSFGIGTSQADNEYPIIVIDPNNQKVELRGTGWGDDTSFGPVPYSVFIAAAQQVVEKEQSYKQLARLVKKASINS